MTRSFDLSANLALRAVDGGFVLDDRESAVSVRLTERELRWLCLVAGPAALPAVVPPARRANSAA